jgi:ABC-type transport system involved in cytochrome bd biosynthesis fused ATPase/permease subunit
MLDAIINAVLASNFLPLILLMVATVITAALAKHFFTGQGNYRDKATTYLMTRSENTFFKALQDAYRKTLRHAAHR